jgi:hypothetical protein
MSKMRFQIQCLCGDQHLGVTCKKPSFVTPTMVKVRCDECGSTTLLQVTLPKNRESRSQVSFKFVKVNPSQKLLEILDKQTEQNAAPKSINRRPSRPLPNHNYNNSKNSKERLK